MCGDHQHLHEVVGGEDREDRPGLAYLRTCFKPVSHRWGSETACSIPEGKR